MDSEGVMPIREFCMYIYRSSLGKRVEKRHRLALLVVVVRGIVFFNDSLYLLRVKQDSLA